MHTHSKIARRQVGHFKDVKIVAKNVQNGCEVKWVVAIYKYDDYILLPWKLEMENQK